MKLNFLLLYYVIQYECYTFERNDSNLNTEKSTARWKTVIRPPTPNID